MSDVRRFTTPTLALSVTGADLTGCAAWLTLAQGAQNITIRLDSLEDWAATAEGATATVTLTQAQTATFVPDEPVECQVNVVDANGYRFASDIATRTFGRNLLNAERGLDD